MLEYIKNKRASKHQDQLVKQKSPILSPTDEQFLQQIVADPETPQPLLEAHPDRATSDSADVAGETEREIVTESSEVQPEVAVAKGEDKKKKNKAWSFLQRSFSKKDKKKASEIEADSQVTPTDAKEEEHDIATALEKLNLAAEGDSAFSLSKETRELVQKFTVILKDLVNGVPTAYDDLVKFLDDSSSQLQKSYSKMPHYLQKLVTSLPTKLTSTLAPELLAAAAESQGLDKSAAKAAGANEGIRAGAAKAGLAIPSLKELVTKPGAVVGLLKGIMNVLKLRWPAFMGTNVLLSLGLFILLFVLWYCHKRGKEVRLEREKSEEDVQAKEPEKEGEPSGSTAAAAANTPPAAMNTPPATMNTPPATMNTPPVATNTPPAATNTPPAATSTPTPVASE